MSVVSTLQGLALNLRGAGQHDAAMMVNGAIQGLKQLPSLYDVATAYTDRNVDAWSNDTLLAAISRALDEVIGKRV